MSSTIPEDLAFYFSTEETIVNPISSLVVMFFVYGIYVLLFAACSHMLCSRVKAGDPDRPNGPFYLTLTTILFVLSTVFVGVYTADIVRFTIISYTALYTRNFDPLEQYLTKDLAKTVAYALEDLIPVLLNISAEWMLIHRCYVVWSFDRRIALPLVIISVLLNAVGLAGTVVAAIGISDSKELNDKLYPIGLNISSAYSIGSAVFNSIITLLTAGRIWWLHRQVQAHGIYTTDRLVHSVSRIIFESGIIYPVVSIVNIILLKTTSAFDAFPLVPLSAAIAPTLIVVRARFEITTDGQQVAVSDICFTTQPGMVTTRSQVQVGLVEGESSETVGDGKEIATSAIPIN